MMPTTKRPGDALIAEIPSLDEPIEMLIACHGRVRAFTNTLRKLVPHLAEHGADEQARQAASNILRYFDIAAPKHHADEEEDLFPALRTAMAGRNDDATLHLSAALDRLLTEHEVLHGLWQHIRPALMQISQGQPAVIPDAEAFADTYQAHAAREEAEVFPAAVALLDAATLAAISARMTARRRDN